MHLGGKFCTLALGLCTLIPIPALAQARAQAPTAAMIHMVPTSKKLIAFTFDDGPNRRFTPQVLRLLRQHGARATFFLVGQEVVRHPVMVHEIEAAGMEIGNHGMHHRLLRHLRREEVRADVVGGADAILEAGGTRPYLYRFPLARSDPGSRRELGRLGYLIVSWSIDTRDWRPAVSSDRIVQTILRNARPGAIVIMHDGPAYRGRTVRALGRVLPRLAQMGYRVVSVGDLLRASDFQSLRRLAPAPALHPVRSGHASARESSWAWRHLFPRGGRA